MSSKKIEAFHIIGLSIRTTNENGQSGKDIPTLWAKFMSEQTIEKIPKKLSTDIFCIYTNYESDHTKPYTTLLGCKVADLKNIPAGMTGMSFNESEYKCFTAKGNLMEGAVWNKWTEIWKEDIDRSYTADFEIYGEKAQNPQDAEVEIFIALK